MLRMRCSIINGEGHRWPQCVVLGEMSSMFYDGGEGLLYFIRSIYDEVSKVTDERSECFVTISQCCVIERVIVMYFMNALNIRRIFSNLAEEIAGFELAKKRYFDALSAKHLLSRLSTDEDDFSCKIRTTPYELEDFCKSLLIRLYNRIFFPNKRNNLFLCDPGDLLGLGEFLFGSGFYNMLVSRDIGISDEDETFFSYERDGYALVSEGVINYEQEIEDLTRLGLTEFAKNREFNEKCAKLRYAVREFEQSKRKEIFKENFRD